MKLSPFLKQEPKGITRIGLPSGRALRRVSPFLLMVPLIGVMAGASRAEFAVPQPKKPEIVNAEREDTIALRETVKIDIGPLLCGLGLLAISTFFYYLIGEVKGRASFLKRLQAEPNLVLASNAIRRMHDENRKWLWNASEEELLNAICARTGLSRNELEQAIGRHYGDAINFNSHAISYRKARMPDFEVANAGGQGYKQDRHLSGMYQK